MTFPTLADLAFYQYRTRPAWAARIDVNRGPNVREPEARRPSIDAVVNAHAYRGYEDRIDTETHNLCAMARYWQRRGELAARLAELVATPSGPQPAKRQALARKWLARITPKPIACSVGAANTNGKLTGRI